MDVFWEELHKNIKKHHIGLVVLVLSLVRLVFGVCLTEIPYGVNMQVEAVKEDYLEFVGEFGGALSAEFENRLAQGNARQREAENKLARLNLEVGNGSLRQKDYVDGLLEYYDVLGQTEVMKALNNQLGYMKEDPERRYFLYGNGWIALFRNMKLDFMYLLVLILGMAPLFVREYETGMDVLNRLSRKGNGVLYAVKLLFALGFSVITGGLFFAVDVLAAGLRFGINHADYPLQSLHIFLANPAALTIGQQLRMGFFITITGGVLASMCIILLTLLFQKMVPAVVVFLSVLLLPNYMFEEEELVKLPNLTTLLNRSGYIVGMETKESVVTYFMDVKTIWLHLLAYVLFAALLAVLGFLIYCKKGKLLGLCAVLFLTGCGRGQAQTGVNNYFAGERILANEAYVIDMTGDAPRVITRDGSEALFHDAFYGCEPYEVRLGYLAGEELYYQKEFAGQDSFELCKVNLRTFETTGIYKEPGSAVAGYPYLRETETRYRPEKEKVRSFYVYGNTVILYRDGRFYKVNKRNGKKSLLPTEKVRDFAFSGDTLYYISERYELFRRNLEDGEEEGLCDFLVNKVFACGETLYIEALEQVIYAYEINSGQMTELVRDAEKLVCADGNHIYYLPEENVLGIVTIADGTRREVVLGGSIMAVASYRNGELLYLVLYRDKKKELVVLTM